MRPMKMGLRERMLAVSLTAAASALTLFPCAALADALSPRLIFTDMKKDGTELAIVSVRPGDRKVLGTLDVLPGMEPFSALSADGRSVFLARHTDRNHPERTAELFRFDLAEGRLERVADGADASPVQPLGPRSVAWTETLAMHPVSEERAAQGELSGVDISLMASFDGEVRELARFSMVYGVHFAGTSSAGLVLYVVRRTEAAFYLLPLPRTLAVKADGAIRGIEPSEMPQEGKTPVEFADDDSIPNPGLIRLAGAPEGPFARDFMMSGETLIFASRLSSSSESSDEFGLFALDAAMPFEQVRRGETSLSRSAVRLEATGSVQPSPRLSASGKLFFSRSDDSAPTRTDASQGTSQNLITSVRWDASSPHCAESPEARLSEVAAHFSSGRARWLLGKGSKGAEASKSEEGSQNFERTEILRIRGKGRVAAASPDGAELAVEHLFDTSRRDAFGGTEMARELLWIVPEARQVTRIEVSDFHDVLGFSEVSP